MSARGAVLGPGIALPITAGATPAYAEAHLSVVKTHEGNFAQGWEGVYTIVVTDSGNTATTGAVHLTDSLPPGLTMGGLGVELSPDDSKFFCDLEERGAGAVARSRRPWTSPLTLLVP
ncbi:hypothetical protein [Streptomyces sp. NPDC054787]